MTVTYIIDENCTAKLWPEFLMTCDDMEFITWLWYVKIPYADSVKPTPLGHRITFKEEKDLTFFLLTL